MKKNKKKAGSLLLESLLAIVILSVALVLLIQSMTASLRAARYSSDFSVAVVLAENKMYDLLQKGFVENNFQDGGHYDFPFDKYEYTVSAADSGQTQDEGLNQTDIKVSWKSGSKNNSFKIATFLLQPSK